MHLTELREQILEIAGFDPKGFTVQEALDLCERDGCTVYWGPWTGQLDCIL